MVYQDKQDQRRTRDVAQKMNEKGMTAQQIADVLDVSTRTVKRWRKQNFADQLPRGRPVTFSEDELAPLIRDFLREDMNATIEQVRVHLEFEHDIFCSDMTISRILNKDKVTHKKSTYSYSECKDEKVDDFKEVLEAHEGTIYALDEAAFMMNHVPRRGWAPRGRRVLQSRPGIRGQRYSLLLCVRNDSENPVVAWHLIEGGVKAVQFHGILQDLELDDDDVMLILDNARIHKATNVLSNQGYSTIEELAEERGIILNYLPPYMPVLNPVEYCFNTIRQRVEALKPSDEEELRAAIEEGIESLTHMEETFTQAFTNICNPPPGW